MRATIALLFATAMFVLTAQAQNNDVFDLSLEQLMRVRVTTATYSEQRVQDAPGAVSVITRQDIERMGFRTLRDVLLTIPGFQVVQNDDELIVAVRGVYPTTNQKILLMRDGNPMNEAMLDRFEPGYLSLESVKKIEIIRGPSASLYGNPASTAVINIITEDADKKRIQVRGGNHGYLSLDGIYSKKYSERTHLAVFGRISNTSGQTMSRLKTDDILGNSLNDGTTTIEHFPLNFDAGLRWKRGGLTVATSVRRNEQRLYWGSRGQVLNADSLLVQPQMLGWHSNNELVFKPKLKNEKFSLNFQHYVNYGYVGIKKSPTPPGGFTVRGTDTTFYPHGRLLHLEWNGIRAGANYFGSYQYAEGGSLLIGVQVERRQYLKSSYAANYYPLATPDSMQTSANLVPAGGEMRNAVYGQWQQSLLKEKLIVNFGARLDVPQNFNPTFNPRLALIFKPVEKLTFKAVLAQGFQAPGYLYRNSVPALGYGSTDNLNAEIIRSNQFIIRYASKKNGYFEVVMFRNTLTNLVTLKDGLYRNLGAVVIQGVEADGRVDFAKWAIFGNLTLMQPDTTQTDSLFRVGNVKAKTLKHVSSLTGMLGATYRPNNYLNATVYGQYFGGFFTGKAGAEVENPSYLLLNGAILYRDLIGGLDCSLNVYNLLNKRYSLGDRDTARLPQQGLWAQIGVAIDLK